jgi:hypothetical protein
MAMTIIKNYKLTSPFLKLLCPFQPIVGQERMVPEHIRGTKPPYQVLVIQRYPSSLNIRAVTDICRLGYPGTTFVLNM